LPPSTPSRVALTTVPREVPPPVDPQSIHYPGFHVYQDGYIVTTPVVDHDVDVPFSPQNDGLKENIAPRRKPRKSATAPAASDLKPGLCSPDTRVTKATTPSTPGSSRGMERFNSATPTSRRPDV
ncbi:hypothetical protein B0H10DRAFT_1690076, partial [Mycena sp. CBHHK59/15]